MIDVADLEKRIWHGSVFAILIALPPISITGVLQIMQSDLRQPDLPLLQIAGVWAMIHLSISLYMARRRASKMLRGAMGWHVEERPPTADERERLIAFPLRHALRILPWWIPSVAGWIVVHLLLIRVSTMWAFISTIGVFLASAVCGAISYLLTEDLLRPVFAFALAESGPPAEPRARLHTRLLIYWFAGTASYLAGIAAIFALFDQEIHRPAGIACCVLGVIVGSFMTTLVARAVTDPLFKVRAGMERIGAGDLDVLVDIDDPGEVGQLQHGFNRMVVGLRERDRLDDLFGRNVGPEVARRALDHQVGLEGTVQDATILFVDVIGSTALAAKRSPQAVVQMLNAMFGAVVRTVGAEGGFVNQFQGDGALCIFGAPAQTDDHAGRALRAALALRRELDRLADAYPGFAAAIGLSSGQVVAGDIGTDDRHEYTVIGDAVNEASRLCDAAKEAEGRLLASAATVTAGEAAGWDACGELRLRGRRTPTAVFEPALS